MYPWAASALQFLKLFFSNDVRQRVALRLPRSVVMCFLGCGDAAHWPGGYLTLIEGTIYQLQPNDVPSDGTKRLREGHY